MSVPWDQQSSYCSLLTLKCSFHRCSSNWKKHPVFPHSAKCGCKINSYNKTYSLSSLLPLCEILGKGPGFMRIIRKRPVATRGARTTDVLRLPLLLHSLVHPSNIAGKLWVRANWMKETNKSIADTLLHFQSFRFDHTPQQSNSLPDDKWQPWRGLHRAVKKTEQEMFYKN